MLNLRDYQTDIITKTHQSMKSRHKRPLVCLPTGAGKTVVFAWLANQTQKNNKTVWFLVHRRELMDQTVETFSRFGIPMDRIHIGMVATVANHPEKLPRPDLIIFDEGHHAAAGTWRKIASRFPDAFLVGLTATPCRLDGKPLGEIYDDLIVGVSSKQLINTGFLSQYRYFAPAVADMGGLKRKGSDYDMEQAGEMLTRRAVFGDVIRHWRKYADGLQTIVYCSSIKHSQATAEAFQADGINAVHFDGNTPGAERKQIVSDFRAGKITVLTNVDLIGEGFDVPDCHCCILLRPTTSLGLFIQQAGRALRPQPGKVAVILDHVGNYTRHGLPDDDREWSLNETVKPPKEYSEDGKLIVRQCTKCYGTFKTGPAVCPYCGAVIESTRKELENIESIELQQITAVEKKQKRIEVGRARSYKELIQIGQERGYAPGWAYMQAKRRGII